MFDERAGSLPQRSDAKKKRWRPKKKAKKLQAATDTRKD